MFSLFRNPLFILWRRFWWLALMITAVAWGAGGATGLAVAMQVLGACLAVTAGMVTVALEHGAYATLQASFRRFAAHHRFLCPQCLHLTHYRFACGGCGNEVESFLVHTRGVYVNECPSCHEPLFSRGTTRGRGWLAYCHNCYGTCSLAPYHARRVSVLATLLPADFEAFGQLPEAQRGQAADLTRFICLDDGECLSYILDYHQAEAWDSVMPTHALRQVEAIWIDAGNVEPLQLGRAVDTFIRQWEQSGRERSQITVCVRQRLVDPVVKGRLEAQFKQVRYGVEPAAFLKPSARLNVTEVGPFLFGPGTRLNLKGEAGPVLEAQVVTQTAAEPVSPAKLTE